MAINIELAAKAEREARRICRERGLPEALWYLANEYIARLSRELEEAREIIRDLVDDEDAGLVWLGRRLVCAYCTADGLYSVAHAADCPIIRARHAIAALRSEAQGEEV